MPDSEPENLNSTAPTKQNNEDSAEDTLQTILNSQEQLQKAFDALQQQMLSKPSEEVEKDDARIESKLNQIQEEIMRQPAQLRGLKRQVNLVTAAVGQSRYKSLVERLLNFLDLIAKAQIEFNKQYGDSIKVDFIEPLYKELLQILNVNDVGILPVVEDQAFDSSVHKCVFIQQVNNENAANKIHQVVKPGYYYTGSEDGEKEILRHAEVVVTKFHQDQPSAEKSDIEKASVKESNKETSDKKENFSPAPVNETDTQVDKLKISDDSTAKQLEEKPIIKSDKGE